MDKQNISETLSSWIRAVSGAIGVLLLTVFVLWNNENEKSSEFTQETKTYEMQNDENLSQEVAEYIKNQEKEKSSTFAQKAKTNKMRNDEKLSPDEAESLKDQKAEIINIEYR